MITTWDCNLATVAQDQTASALSYFFCFRNPGLAAKLEAERKLKEGISGHKTGLPKKLLELFEPLPALAKAEPIRKRKPKLGFLGIAQYVSNFAEPGEPEYEPPMPEDCPPSPRLFANPELRAQARVEKESKAEKCVIACVCLQCMTSFDLRCQGLHDNSSAKISG